MKDNSSSSSWNPNTFIILLLLGVGWFSWDKYMRGKYPDYYGSKTPLPENQEAIKEQKPSDHQKGNVKPSSTPKALSFLEKESSLSPPTLLPTTQKGKPSNVEKWIPFEDEIWSFSLSSKGMGIKDLVLKKFSDRKFQPMKLGGEKNFLPLETHLLKNQKSFLYFNVQKKGNNEFVGKASLGDIQVTKSLFVDSKNYIFQVKTHIKDPSREFQGLSTFFSDDVKKKKKSSLFLPSFDQQELYVTHGKNDKERIGIEEEEWHRSFDRVKLASFGSQYFAMAFLNQSMILPQMEVFISEKNREALSIITHKTLQPTEDLHLNYTFFIGPKSYEVLKNVPQDFQQLVDLGFFGFIASYMLIIMNFFFQIFHNWGVAIILMTVLVRILLLPLNIKSYRSMKAMQKIQPQMKKIREQLKETPQKMNQEIMSLMRTHKVNPLGGCLPMLLQFPVFLALYKVLGQSVELYQAPFIFWLDDLSVKDPYYVLPVLMGGVMFWQQKITPAPMDPTQAKVLMVMPLIFTVFMLALPSGLTLYILVSSLFAIIQQFFFMKDHPQTNQ